MKSLEIELLETAQKQLEALRQGNLEDANRYMERRAGLLKELTARLAGLAVDEVAELKAQYESILDVDSKLIELALAEQTRIVDELNDYAKNRKIGTAYHQKQTRHRLVDGAV